MKELTKARLLKTKGIIKKACVWSPVAVFMSGIGIGLGLLLGGGVKEEKGIEQFKNSEIFIEQYDQAYEEAKDKYDSGEFDLDQLNDTINEINSTEYVYQVLNGMGDEAKEYKEMVKTGKQYMLGSIGGFALVAVGIGMLIPWIGFDVASSIDLSGDNDLAKADSIIYNEKEKEEKRLKEIEKEKLKNQKEKEEREQYEKMLKEGFIEESEEEEELPDIQDSYYRD